MAKRQPLKVVPSPARQPDGDPLRAALVAALAAERKARARLDGHHQAITRAGEQLAESERQVEKRRAGIDAAKTAFAGELADALARSTPLPATSALVASADAAMLDAERSAEAVRTARDRLKADLRNVEIELHLSEVDTIAATNAALAPSIAKLIALAEASRVTMYQCAAILQEVRARRADTFTWRENEWKASWAAGDRRRPMDALKDQIDRFATRIHNKDLDTNTDQVVAAWRAVVEQLRTDPSAALPALPGET
jgi:hypothetical protein